MKPHQENHIKQAIEELVRELVREFGRPAFKIVLDHIKTLGDTEGHEPGDTCDKNDPHDPHYGEAGYYDERCVWHPDV